MSDPGENQAENLLGRAEQERNGEIFAEPEARFENKQEAIRAAMEKFRGVIDERGKVVALDADFSERISTRGLKFLFRAIEDPANSPDDLVAQKTLGVAQMAADVIYPRLMRLKDGAKTANETYFTRERGEIESLLRQASRSDDPLKAIESANDAIVLFERVVDGIKRERDEAYRLRRGLIDDANQNASRATFLDLRTEEFLAGYSGNSRGSGNSVAARYATDSKTFSADIERYVAEDFGPDRKLLEDLRAATDEFRAIAQEIGKR
jgi:hypothetical protein